LGGQIGHKTLNLLVGFVTAILDLLLSSITFGSNFVKNGIDGLLLMFEQAKDPALGAFVDDGDSTVTTEWRGILSSSRKQFTARARKGD
jgi:hypothetical protein